MRRLLAWLLLAAAPLVASARASEPRPAALLLLADDVTPPADAQARGLDVAAPAPQAAPASEAVLSLARPLYNKLAFARAAERLADAEQALIAGRVPSTELTRALAEIELWRGACLWLAKKRAPALERWALAARLQPGARPDRIFPPEVHAAFAHRPPAPRAVSVDVRLAPAGARLWLDGKLASGKVSAQPGLHYVVVERADLVAQASLTNVTRSGAELAVSLRDAAPPTDALRQAVERVRAAPLGADEGLGVSRALERPLWIVSRADAGLRADRYAAADPARPVAHVEAARGESLVEQLCSVEGTCARPAPAPSLAPPPPPPVISLGPPTPAAPPPRPHTPVWKRAWFWGVIAGSAVVVAGAATGIALAAGSSRDYDIRVR
jgi:hypothetical protein